MSKGRGCRGTLVKLVKLPMRGVSKLTGRIFRTIVRSLMKNVVWFVTAVLTVFFVVKNFCVNVLKNVSGSTCEKKIVVVSRSEGRSVVDVIHDAYEKCAAVFGRLTNSFTSLVVKVTDPIKTDYEKFSRAESNFRHKIKNNLTSVSDKFNSTWYSLKYKVSELFTTVSDTGKQLVSSAADSVKNFFGVFIIKASTAKDKAVDKVSVVAIKLKGVSDTAYIKAQNVKDTVRLGTYFVVEEGKKGFPTSRRTIARGTLQIRDGIIYNIERAKLAFTNSRIYIFFSSRINKRITDMQNVTTLDSVVFFSIVGLLGYFFYLVFDKQQKENYHRSLKIYPSIRDACKDMLLEEPTLRKCMESLHQQILLGLDPKTQEKSTVKCYNTYVQDLPTGKESGQFLALDLGGTNFRVLLITLNGHLFDMTSKIYVIPQDIMTGSGDELFDHIASCLEAFVREHRIADKNLPLGFTFSFPLKQIGLTKGILQKWTKGFNCTGVVGEDVVELLEIAIKKKNINIDVLAVLNDTTGTLMSCAWKNHNCKLGIILGTGTNACYAEKVENVKGYDAAPGKPLVLINTEWGAFGEKGELDFIRTSYDREIDENSINPGKQIHEKMISGMYLGELVRLLLAKFAREKTLFNGELSERLNTKGSFPTEFISEIESDKRGTFKNCRKVLGKLHMHDVSDQDCANIRYVCECVSRRAAHLASAGIATLINKMKLESVTVGVDGSLYRYHPYFHDLMIEKIGQLVSPSVHVSLMLSEDGSGRGAALVAASSI